MSSLTFSTVQEIWDECDSRMVSSEDPRALRESLATDTLVLSSENYKTVVVFYWPDEVTPSPLMTVLKLPNLFAGLVLSD